MSSYKILQNKLNLIKNISPIQELKEISNKKIYIKREDLIDFGIGGNKVRLLEYIAYDICRLNKKKIITFGSMYSNHIRTTANIANMLNLECDIIIIKNQENNNQEIYGNRLLLELFNCNINYCDSEEARDYIDNYLEDQNKKNISYYFIPGGGHSNEGALGYVNAMFEIYQQCKDKNIQIDTIVLPTGTGTTQSGLIYGSRLLNFDIDILGISIARTKDRCRYEIETMLEGLNNKFCNNYEFNDTDIIIIDKYLSKYSKYDDCQIEVTKKFIKNFGIFLDPIYNGKAFSILNKMILNKEIKGENILYLNTGGLPNVFSKEFVEEMIKNECTNN